MNKAGAIVREEPYSFFGPVVTANQATPTYGVPANAAAMDALMVTTAATNAVLVDQSGNSTTFASIPVGIYLLSPSQISNVGGGTFVPLYK